MNKHITCEKCGATFEGDVLDVEELECRVEGQCPITDHYNFDAKSDNYEELNFHD